MTVSGLSTGIRVLRSRSMPRDRFSKVAIRSGMGFCRLAMANPMATAVTMIVARWSICGGTTQLISFDPQTGLLTAEAGLMLSDIIALAAPHGYFLPVDPRYAFCYFGRRDRERCAWQKPPSPRHVRLPCRTLRPVEVRWNGRHLFCIDELKIVCRDNRRAWTNRHYPFCQHSG